MDWITGIQTALDYIEAHIDDDLDYDRIAKESFSSPFHFQRIFSILCGYTLGEYIRNRRLSIAGTRLATSKEKVIDIALRYGYDSPDSFAKAFQKFHGITPVRSAQRRGKAQVLLPPVHQSHVGRRQHHELSYRRKARYAADRL